MVDQSENIEMRYHQVNDKDELMTGICFSKPEILENGKIRFMKNGNGLPATNQKEHQ